MTDAGNTIIAQVIGLIGLAVVVFPLTRIVFDLAPSDVSDAVPGVRRSCDPGNPRRRFETGPSAWNPDDRQAWTVNSPLPTALVTRPSYAATRELRRHYVGSHRWTGLAIGQRRPHEFAHPHIVRGHASS